MKYRPNVKAKLCFMGLLVFGLLINSCDSTETSPPLAVSDDYFPNKIGNEWRYQYFDSLRSISDTIIVSIVGDTVLSEYRIAKIWEYQFKNKTEYGLVEEIDDTVRFTNYYSGNLMNTVLILPLEVDSCWGGELWYYDSIKVISKGSLSVLAGHYEESYLIQETWGGLNDYGEIHAWFVPGVGIIKRHHVGWSFGAANNYIELFDCHVE